MHRLPIIRMFITHLCRINLLIPQIAGENHGAERVSQWGSSFKRSVCKRRVESIYVRGEGLLLWGELSHNVVCGCSYRFVHQRYKTTTLFSTPTSNFSRRGSAGSASASWGSTATSYFLTRLGSGTKIILPVVMSNSQKCQGQRST